MNKKIIITLLLSLYPLITFSACREKQLKKHSPQQIKDMWEKAHRTLMRYFNPLHPGEDQEIYNEEFPEIKTTLKTLTKQTIDTYIQANAMSGLAIIYGNHNKEKKACKLAKKLLSNNNYMQHISPKAQIDIYKMIGFNSKNNEIAIDHLEKAIKIMSKLRQRSEYKTQRQAFTGELIKCISKISHLISSNDPIPLENKFFKKHLKKIMELKEDITETPDIILINNILATHNKLGKIYCKERKKEKAHKIFKEALMFIEEKNKQKAFQRHVDLYKELHLDTLNNLLMLLPQKIEKKEIKKYKQIWGEKKYSELACDCCQYYRKNKENITCDVCKKMRYCSEDCKKYHKQYHEKKCKPDTCANCGETQTKLNRCGRCKKVFYCSRECQIKDWKKHKKNCKE